MNGYAVSLEEKYALESKDRNGGSNNKVKKPGFIKRWLMKHVKEVIQQDREIQATTANISRGIGILAVERGNSLDSQPMHLKIYRANGGTIVETSTYDKQRDRHGNQLHIIGHDTDLGEGLSKIITMESLRG